MSRKLNHRLTELEEACRRRSSSLADRSGVSSSSSQSLFDLDNTDIQIERVLSASIKSVKTMALGKNIWVVTIHWDTPWYQCVEVGNSMAKSLNQISLQSVGGVGGTLVSGPRRRLLRKDTSITSSIFSSNSSDSCGSQVSVILPRQPKHPGYTR